MHAPLHVVCAADDAYAMPLAVTAYSVMRHHAGPRPLSFHFIDGGLTAENRARVERVLDAPGTTVRWLRPSAERLSRFIIKKSYITVASYYRLLIPDLLPADCRRVLYLDVDMLVLRDVEALWEIPFDGHPLMAVRDYGVSVVSHPNGVFDYEALGLAPDHPYFNAGLLVLDLEAWRRERLSEQIFAYIEASGSRLMSEDQGALNAVLARRWKPLDLRWNYTGLPPLDAMPEGAFKREVRALGADALRDPFLLHYTATAKPWAPHAPPSAHRARYARYVLASGWFTPAGWAAWRLRLKVHETRWWLKATRSRRLTALKRRLGVENVPLHELLGYLLRRDKG